MNQHLLKDLTELGLWDETMKHKLIAYGGSVQVRALTVNTEGKERGGSGKCYIHYALKILREAKSHFASSFPNEALRLFVVVYVYTW